VNLTIRGDETLLQARDYGHGGGRAQINVEWDSVGTNRVSESKV